MFEDLLKMEQKLDWTILRKKAEVNDAIGKPTRVSYTSGLCSLSWNIRLTAVSTIDKEDNARIPFEYGLQPGMAEGGGYRSREGTYECECGDRRRNSRLGPED
jgi:hypothetical protein